MIHQQLSDLVGKSVEIWCRGDIEPSFAGTLKLVHAKPAPDYMIGPDGPNPDLASVAFADLLDDNGLRCRVAGDHITAVCWRPSDDDEPIAAVKSHIYVSAEELDEVPANEVGLAREAIARAVNADT